MDIEFSTRALLMTFFKHKMKIFVVFCTIMALGILYILSIQGIYTARASFLVKFGQGAVPNVNVDQVSRSNDYGAGDRSELLQSYMNIIQSYNLVYNAIDQVGFEKVYPEIDFKDKAANAKKEKLVKLFITTSLSTGIVDRSNIIEIEVSHKNPDISYQLTDAILSGFIRKQTEIYNATPSDFLQQRLDDVSKQRDEYQSKLSEFKQKNNITDIDAEIDQLLQEKRELSNISFGSTASNETAISNLITELETKKAELEATYRPDSIVLKKINDSLAAAKSSLVKAGGGDASVTRKGISVAQRLKEIDDRMAFLESHRGEFNDLKQNAVAGDERANYFKQRVEDARLNQVLNQENISRITVIDKPDIPTIPIQKSKKILALAFLMLAIFVSAAMVVFLELVDDRISTPEQLEIFCGFPVIGSFSKAELE